ncbi:MAG: hypothetical protein Q7S87_05210 [Agitococcus sp.]|nr:hypothetical protein [Agitococcus sp.]
MVIVPPPLSAVSLFSRDGFVRQFSSAESLLAYRGYAWLVNNIGPNFRIAVGTPPSVEYVSYPFVLRDDSGDTVTVPDIVQATLAYKKDYRPYRFRYAFQRNSPTVSGTAKPKAGTFFYRRISHMNARRGAETFAEEGEVPTRGKRNQQNLPNPWDDYRASSFDHDSWKQYRRQQWREKK